MRYALNIVRGPCARGTGGALVGIVARLRFSSLACITGMVHGTVPVLVQLRCLWAGGPVTSTGVRVGAGLEHKGGLNARVRGGTGRCTCTSVVHAIARHCIFETTSWCITLEIMSLNSRTIRFSNTVVLRAAGDFVDYSRAGLAGLVVGNSAIVLQGKAGPALCLVKLAVAVGILPLRAAYRGLRVDVLVRTHTIFRGRGRGGLRLLDSIAGSLVCGTLFGPNSGFEHTGRASLTGGIRRAGSPCLFSDRAGGSGMRSTAGTSAAGLEGIAGTGFTLSVVCLLRTGGALEASGASAVQVGTRIRAGQGELEKATSGTAGCGRVLHALIGTRRAGVAKVVLIRWSDNHVVPFWTTRKGLTAYDTGASRVPVGGSCAKLTAGGRRALPHRCHLGTSSASDALIRIDALLVGPRRARLTRGVGFPPFIGVLLASSAAFGDPRRALGSPRGREGAHGTGLACIRVDAQICCSSGTCSTAVVCAIFSVREAFSRGAGGNILCQTLCCSATAGIFAGRAGRASAVG